MTVVWRKSPQEGVSVTEGAESVAFAGGLEPCAVTEEVVPEADVEGEESVVVRNWSMLVAVTCASWLMGGTVGWKKKTTAPSQTERHIDWDQVDQVGQVDPAHNEHDTDKNDDNENNRDESIEIINIKIICLRR